MTGKDCVFCEILRGERLDTEILAEGDYYIVLKPIKPVVEGHLLFIPKIHFERFTERTFLAADIFETAARWALHNPGYEDSNIIVSQGKSATQTVSHLHIHLVPRQPDDGLLLPWGKLASDHKPKSQPLSVVSDVNR
jgi:histidine triad (HIT) family protein